MNLIAFYVDLNKRIEQIFNSKRIFSTFARQVTFGTDLSLRRHKTSGKVRGHQWTWSFWKINPTWLTGGGLKSTSSRSGDRAAGHCEPSDKRDLLRRRRSADHTQVWNLTLVFRSDSRNVASRCLARTVTTDRADYPVFRNGITTFLKYTGAPKLQNMQQNV